MRKRVILVVMLIGIIAPLTALLAQDDSIILTISVPPWREDVFKTPGFFARFEAEHPGVKVVLAPTADNAFFVPAAFDIEQHLDMAESYASTADVLYISNDNLSIEATRAGLFLDLAPLAAGDPDLNPEDFFPGAYESYQWDRGLWGLPVSMDVEIVIYDPATFDAAGLEYPNERWTLDDFANADRALTQYDDSGVVTRPGCAVFGSSRILLPSLLKHGFYDPTTIPQQPKFTDPDTEALLARWIEYQREGLLGGAPLSGSIDFNAIPLQISGTFQLTGNVG